MKWVPRLFLLLYCCFVLVASICLFYQPNWQQMANFMNIGHNTQIAPQLVDENVGNGFIRSATSSGSMSKYMPDSLNYNTPYVGYDFQLYCAISFTPPQLQEVYLYQQLLTQARQELAAELRAFDIGRGCEERVRELIAEVELQMVVLEGLAKWKEYARP